MEIIKNKKYKIESLYDFDDDRSETWEYFKEKNPQEEKETEDQYSDRIKKEVEEDNENFTRRTFSEITNDDGFTFATENEDILRCKINISSQEYTVLREIETSDYSGENIKELNEWITAGNNTVEEI